MQVDKNILNNPNLSWKAKGILIYLLSHSDKWVPQVEDIAEHGTSGRDSVHAALRELRDEGYARMVYQQTSDNGQFKGRGWHIYESPQKTGHSVERVLRATAKLPLRNNKGKNNTQAAGAAQCDLIFESGNFPSTPAGELCLHFERFIKSHKLNWVIDRRNGKKVEVKINRNYWLRACATLLNEVRPTTIKETMDWYFKHHHEQYVPKCGSLMSFCENFQRVQNAHDRSEGIVREDEEDIDHQAAESERLNSEYLRSHRLRHAD